MVFGSFLMLIAITIAGVSAYFSVYGLAHIFAATFWSVVLMGGVLEVGKLVATSFLYRYWERVKWPLRIYLLTAIAGLMLITSAGIFGYLSNAYQQDIVGVKDVSARIELLDSELSALTTREQQINTDIDRIGSNFVTARQNMIKQYDPEKDKLTTRIAEIRAERLELSTKQLEVEAHTGPIIYIAKAMDKGVDTAVMWMICLIIFVFDPLAVALTIGANIVLSQRTQQPHPPHIEGHPCRVCGTAYNSVEAADSCEGDCMSEWYNNAPQQNEVSPSAQHTDDEFQALEEENIRKQDVIDELSSDNQQMEEDLVILASVIEKKELQIAQLKEAVRSMEQQPAPLPYTIEQRASLHAQNIAASK